MCNLISFWIQKKKMYTIHKFSWQIHSNGIWVFTTLVLPFLLGFRFLKIKLWEKILAIIINVQVLTEGSK